MIPKYDLSDFIFMVTALVFHQHASKRQQKNLFCRHERLLRGKKSKKTKAIQIKKEIGKKTKQSKTKPKKCSKLFWQGSKQVSE